MNHNWSAMKQRLHPQSVAETSIPSTGAANSVSGDEKRQDSPHPPPSQAQVVHVINGGIS